MVAVEFVHLLGKQTGEQGDAGSCVSEVPWMGVDELGLCKPGGFWYQHERRIWQGGRRLPEARAGFLAIQASVSWSMT